MNRLSSISLMQALIIVQQTYLERFPEELLLIIKEFIPHSDLRSHVCLYQSYPCFAALYGPEAEQEAFWKQACWLSGIGWTQTDEVTVIYSTCPWKEFAFDSIWRDGFFQYPHCGGALLERNAQRIQTYCDKLTWDSDEYEDGAKAHELLLRILFRGEKPTTLLEELEFDDAHLLPPSIPEKEGCAAADYALRRHPLVCRSFVTFPPCSEMYLTNFFKADDPIQLRYRHALTVWDFVESLRALLDEPLSVHDLWLNFLRLEFQEAFPPNVNMLDRINELETSRILLKFVHLDMIDIDAYADGTVFWYLAYSAYEPQERRPRVVGERILMATIDDLEIPDHDE